MAQQQHHHAALTAPECLSTREWNKLAPHLLIRDVVEDLEASQLTVAKIGRALRRLRCASMLMRMEK